MLGLGAIRRNKASSAIAELGSKADGKRTGVRDDGGVQRGSGSGKGGLGMGVGLVKKLWPEVLEAWSSSHL